MEFAGLIYDRSTHYIDHLAPFCSLMNWPLIVCEPSVSDLIQKFYPDIKIIEESPLKLKLPPHIVTCDTDPVIRATFPNQKTKTLWLPHGNSDKGHSAPFFEALRDQEIALVYGKKMVDFMNKKGVFPKTVPIGNFRYHYFLKHKEFYKALLDPIIPKTGTHFLYAPTWDDSEGNGSFWKTFPHLSANVPGHCNLLIKLHPNTIEKFEPEIEQLKSTLKPNVHFIPELPPIYPLLSRCDAYIGDISSIGYDFLTFGLPMFFLNTNKPLDLHQCGSAIDPKSFHFLATDDFSFRQKKLYAFTFEKIDFNSKSLLSSLKSLLTGN